ncbi:MAG: AAA family ATPase [Gammaproteobacteria bacterium]|nr:AAA family ATPase [Gammaproteobacteria bacterium]
MAKTLVVDKVEDTRVPFLRGILTRSLQEVGLEFKHAYDFSSAIRNELSGVPEITTVELRERVYRGLLRTDPRVARAYRMPAGVPARPMIRDFEGQVLPFSELTYRRSLEASGTDMETATTMARQLLEHLLMRREAVIPSAVLGRLTYGWLRRTQGEKIARRYMVWVDYRQQGRPLILLVGGTPGCGKSTVVAELANRLEIQRIQSTDMLREVMRMLIPERLLPVLHRSSFNAWQALPTATTARRPGPEAMADGFRSQAELLALPCEAVIDRALKERVSLILEGVHIEPSLHQRIEARGGAVVVPLTLAVFKSKQLRRRFARRGRIAEERPPERYEQNFDAIWDLQSYLLDEADRCNVPIVNNDEKERAAHEIMGIVVDALAEGFDKAPREVFR